MSSRVKSSYSQIIAEKVESIRVENELSTTDFFLFKIAAKSDTAIRDFSAVKRQLKTALTQLIDEFLQPPKATDTYIELEEVFNEIRPVIARLGKGKTRTPGRKQVRLDRIWRAFRSSKGIVITLEDLADEFKSTADPEKSASSAVGWLNKQLKNVGSEIEIERITAYKIRKRK